MISQSLDWKAGPGTMEQEQTSPTPNGAVIRYLSGKKVNNYTRAESTHNTEHRNSTPRYMTGVNRTFENVYIGRHCQEYS